MSDLIQGEKSLLYVGITLIVIGLIGMILLQYFNRPEYKIELINQTDVKIISETDEKIIHFDSIEEYIIKNNE